jgi:hypothetical protein
MSELLHLLLYQYVEDMTERREGDASPEFDPLPNHPANF